MRIFILKKLIAVVVAMMLALAFTACAQEMKKDEMPKDDMMKAEETEKDSMEKDAMAEEAMEKKDEMMGEACMCGDSSKCMMDGACKEKDGCMCMKDGMCTDKCICVEGGCMKDGMCTDKCMCAKKDMMEEKAGEGSEMKEAAAAIGPSCGAPDIDVALSFGCCG